MRGVAVAVGSLLVHAVALAWVTAGDVPPVPVAARQRMSLPVATPVATIDPPPFEVVFLDEPSNRGGGAQVTAPSSAAMPAQRGRITRGTTAATATSETPSTGTGNERSSYMTMRRPGDEPTRETMRGPSEGFLSDFLNRSKPLLPPPDIPGERVGNQIAALRTMLDHADRYSADEVSAMRGELVARNAEREAEELKPAGGGSYKTEKFTFRAKVNPDGSVKLEDKPENMDAQDRMMLRHGIDPYASNKLAYLDRTRDQRFAIGKRFREQELGKSVIYMQQHIARLWSMTTDEAKRKQGLFELWDECSETGTPEEVAGGEAARAFVMAHIRANVKHTPDELRAFNAKRQSKQGFAP